MISASRPANLDSLSLQVTIEVPQAGAYRVRIDGSDVPYSPQNFSMVVTGMFSVHESCSQELNCPGNCSGHGQCVQGLCVCDLAYSGLNCSLKNVVLDCGSTYEISLSSGGWSYYMLGLPGITQEWNLSLITDSGFSGFFVAFNHTPNAYTYDIEGNFTNTSAYFNCAASCTLATNRAGSGMWVLGVTAYCCTTINVTARLTFNSVVGCTAGFTLKPDGCSPCNTSSCQIGQHRSPCTWDADSQCVVCNNKPPQASYTASDKLANENDCPWACNAGYLKSGGSCLEMVTSHVLPSSSIFLTSTKLSTRTEYQSTNAVLAPSSSAVSSSTFVKSTTMDSHSNVPVGFSSPNTLQMLKNISMTISHNLTKSMSTTVVSIPSLSATSTSSLPSIFSSTVYSSSYFAAATESGTVHSSPYLAAATESGTSESNVLSYVSSKGTTPISMETDLQFTVVLPMTPALFHASESKYIAAVASAANCSISWVIILAIRDSSQGRRQVGSIAVDTEINDPLNDNNPQVAEPILTQHKLDNSLQLQGLPPSLGFTIVAPFAGSQQTIILTNSTVAELQTPSPLDSKGAANLIAGVVGGVVSFVVVILGIMAFCRARLCGKPERRISADGSPIPSVVNPEARAETVVVRQFGQQCNADLPI